MVTPADVSVPVVPSFAALTAQDRCDQCSAAALVRVVKDSSDLVFCGHHYSAHSMMLAVGGWTVLENNTAA